jgi:hypothetical protein
MDAQGIAVVVMTGDHTYLGTIADRTKSSEAL